MADLSSLLSSMDPESEEYGQFLEKLAAASPNSSSVSDAQPSMIQPPVQSVQVPRQASSEVPEDLEEALGQDEGGSNLEPDSNTSTLVQDAIAKKYGFGPGLNDEALQAAQQSANSGKVMAGVGAGIDRIISGLSHQNQTPQAAAFYQNLGKEGEQNVQDILQRRQGALQNQALQKQQALEDPNSPQSKAFQNTLSKLYPDVFSSDDLKAISAQDMELVFKPLQLKEQIEARKAQLQAQRDYQQKNRDLQTQLGAQGKLNADQEYKDAITKAGDVDELANAAKLAASNQDPNGLARNLIATKLVPAFTGLKRVNTAEFQNAAGSSDVASVINRLAEKASKGGMDQNDYKQLMGLIQVMKDSSDASKADAINRHVTQYGRATGKSREDAAYDLGIDLPRQPTQAPQKNLSPEDQQALEWAKANPADPRAQKILAHLGA